MSKEVRISQGLSESLTSNGEPSRKMDGLYQCRMRGSHEIVRQSLGHTSGGTKDRLQSQREWAGEG